MWVPFRALGEVERLERQRLAAVELLKDGQDLLRKDQLLDAWADMPGVPNARTDQVTGTPIVGPGLVRGPNVAILEIANDAVQRFVGDSQVLDQKVAVTLELLTLRLAHEGA